MSHVYSRSHMRAAHTNKEKIHPWDWDIAKHFKTYKKGQRDGASTPTKDLSDGLKVCSCVVSRWVCREVIKKKKLKHYQHLIEDSRSPRAVQCPRWAWAGCVLSEQTNTLTQDIPSISSLGLLSVPAEDRSQ